MSRRAQPLVRHERVYWHRLRDEQCVTDFTLEGIAVFVDDELADAYLHPILGPGAGPHYWRDLDTIRAVAWTVHHGADALTAAGFRPPPRLLVPAGHVPGQLTIHDHLEGVSS